jgi:hypothetical protein
MSPIEIPLPIIEESLNTRPASEEDRQLTKRKWEMFPKAGCNKSDLLSDGLGYIQYPPRNKEHPSRFA